MILSFASLNRTLEFSSSTCMYVHMVYAYMYVHMVCVCVNLELANSARLTGQEVPQIPCLLLSNTGIRDMYHHTQRFGWVLGTELRSLCDKHIID